ncbi:3-methyl-2-oxobutanoate dehydrogenase subunit VorB [Ructibacterium gallinarum]|uniref:3-methyl-2-oxobutanoate dehydrogenase subunit VorB n=1 Tax=Ructibacterium gallinarum TaxID=2779355 RepID=A0A9D5R790_9FIRM|nr:3-methyl-2-oxobutanoate dehydrogenase subunit VorB [Ructibacterium gallinarum]MBE5038891.1 3-methyl-2-oxobutanoate dehydrogenase subunit VorB [Ructibacterium gallinarum]
MEKKVLMKGNEALAEAAIRSGCRFFFGYPITPQTELAAYMAKQMPKRGGTFLQAESEIAAINMVYGAAGAGARVMTSSSSPGISLKQEGISYIAGADLPCVIINIVRGGPGLGGIQPAQSDYFQATKGGGHGDYHLLVFAPSSVQEMADLIGTAFDKADQYRMPAMIMGDGMLGQMMEPVAFQEERDPSSLPEKPWATTGTMMKRKKNIINSLYLTPEELENLNNDRQKRYQTIMENEVRVEEYQTEDAELIFVAYGTIARITMSAVNMLREEGIKAGLIRPITLWPFPTEAIYARAAAETSKAFMAVEMSQGQMIEDVRLAVNGKKPVYFYGRNGGMVPDQEAIVKQAKQYICK